MIWQNNLRQWLRFEQLDLNLRLELEQARDLDDRFYCDLAFGTGGLRGVFGAGTNRMNAYTVAKATRGFAQYLNANFAQPSCAIAYDSRNCSEEFAQVTAAALAESGVKVYLYPQLTPTPMLSFAVRHLQCSGGVVITASHNPAQYNGYKVYGADGCQITLEAAAAVLAEIEKQPCIAPLPVFDTDQITYIDDTVVRAYFAAILDACPDRPQVPLRVVYSPLNGAGNLPVRHMLAAIGNVEVIVVPEQEMPDGDFPTCPYPNPEIQEAVALASALAEAERADFFLATDPDCDRVGAGVVTKDGVRRINGNEMGVLLFDFICKMRVEKDTMPQHPVAVKTIVTTEMAAAVAREYKVELRDVLTGFKYIGEQIGLLEAQGRAQDYLFGFEESYGYLSGSFVRDKDAVNAAVLICEMAAYYKQQGKTLLDALAALEQKYGYYRSDLLMFAFEGASGMQAMEAYMDILRARPESLLDAAPRQVMDYAQGIAGLPKSNVLRFAYPDGSTVVVRPSGTEPKLKIYLTTAAPDAATADARLRSLIAILNEKLQNKA